MAGLQDQVVWFPGMTMAQVERVVIQKALQFTQFNKAEAARMLEIAENTLRSKLQKYAEDDANLEAKEKEELEKRQAIQAQLRGTDLNAQSGLSTFKDTPSNGNGSDPHPEPAAAKTSKAPAKKNKR